MATTNEERYIKVEGEFDNSTISCSKVHIGAGYWVCTNARCLCKSVGGPVQVAPPKVHTCDTRLEAYTKLFGVHQAKIMDDRAARKEEWVRECEAVDARRRVNRERLLSDGNVFLDSYETSYSWWDTTVRSLMMCMGMEDIVADWDSHEVVRTEVSRAMLSSYHCVVHSEDGKTATPTTGVEAVVSRAELQTLDNFTGEREVRLVPKLVAASVVAVRMKLGMGSMDRNAPGNLATVRAELAKLVRGYNVREVDGAAHLAFMEEAYFNDSTHFKVPTWRARACQRSRLVRWFFGKEEPGYDC